MKVGDIVVVSDPDSEYDGRIGVIMLQSPGWRTWTVSFSCLVVQFYPHSLRPLDFNLDKVVNP
jgi:hypothetical protein